MKIAHVAIWTADIERTCAFWSGAFDVVVGPLYQSTNRVGFTSRFIIFAEGPSVEVMTGPWVVDQGQGERVGYAHLAISVGSTERVDSIAQAFARDGALVSGPRTTGDGYYEAVIGDRDGNLIEITA
ncbi:MAG: VOC family protein [Paracoccaceae bacterium]